MVTWWGMCRKGLGGCAMMCKDGAGVGSTGLAGVCEENERAPALAFRSGAWIVQE